MQRNYPGGIYKSVYEAGFCGYWIHRDLQELGFDNTIINASDVPTTNKEKDRKNDHVDSNKLSRELENGSLQCIYIPTPYQESLRSLCRLYRQYAKRSTQVKTRIKSFLDFVGVKESACDSGKHWSQKYIQWLSAIIFTERYNQTILEYHLQELRHIRTVQLDLLRQIRDCCKAIPLIRLLRTIPGIGQIVSFVLYTELIDMKRFRSLNELCAYTGLVPSIYSSDEKEKVRGLTRRCSGYLRYILIEAAWIAARCDPAMTAAFCNLTKRMSKKRAIIRIAKKLLNRIRYVWLHEKEYIKATIE